MTPTATGYAATVIGGIVGGVLLACLVYSLANAEDAPPKPYVYNASQERIDELSGKKTPASKTAQPTKSTAAKPAPAKKRPLADALFDLPQGLPTSAAREARATYRQMCDDNMTEGEYVDGDVVTTASVGPSMITISFKPGPAGPMKRLLDVLNGADPQRVVVQVGAGPIAISADGNNLTFVLPPENH